MTNTLNIVGCGKLGRTLGRLWTEARVFSIRDIVNRSLESADSAVLFIGAGRAAEFAALLRPAEVWMIGAADDQIAKCCKHIVATGRLRPGDIIFHCSGAQSSSVLEAAADCGALVASVHPVASFADPLGMLARFDGTFCCIEGDPRAQEVLIDAFARIGAKILPIDAASKIVYHAGAVFASNYLVALLDVAAQTLTATGIPRATALELIRPLAEGSIDNAFRLGTAAALTGPVARGDIDLVLSEYVALKKLDPVIAELYRGLALAAAQLAGKPIDI